MGSELNVARVELVPFPILLLFPDLAAPGQCLWAPIHAADYGGYALFVRAVGVYPDADVLFITGDGNQSYVSCVCERLDCSFEVKFVLASI
jgi:hypothetical protein